MDASKSITRCHLSLVEEDGVAGMHKDLGLPFLDDRVVPEFVLDGAHLRTKKDVFQAFKKFKSVTENTTEYKIKTLRTDCGGEFLSTEFTRFCENEGIERYLTAPYTPQQNGVVERRNRTVMAMARSLLKGDHTPFEAWMGRKPHLAHLRVFGCVAYVKNTTPHLKKLDDRSSPMIYLGVKEACKAHRLFDSRHGKLQVSKDVVFQENSEGTWTAGANHEENLPEFMVEDALDTDEVIVVADIEAGTEDVAPPATAVVPMTRASRSSTGRINKFKQQMMIEFEMSDLGLLSYYLGIEVEQQKSRILLRQSTYAKKILSQFKMADCNATKHPMEPKTQLHKDLEGTPVDATEYRRVIGCLRYLLHTRPDLSYPVGMASRYMERPTTMHHKVVKQILKYLKGTIHFGLTYIKGPQEISIFGYSDSDLTDDLDGRKITSGMTLYFNESLVSWNSQKQKTVALSSCEAEFMAATTATCHALWLRSLTSELTGEKSKPVTLFVDNKSAIALMKNPVFYGQSKHIDTRFHFIRECVENGQIVVEFINTEEQRADVLTKALPGVKLAVMRQLLGVRDLEPCQN
ncbi:hypothetical protein ZIOFF_064731 [Zingiber officinale]|uniref:Integrase catalytic domain-containing protein n=1 Tax=Zingiber officinale TaxID=94328 RepID=A0A8J5EWA3_ZINOF|nr:hypothetical protein ZIOFF_064731 [Zingiber officinale]